MPEIDCLEDYLIGSNEKTGYFSLRKENVHAIIKKPMPVRMGGNRIFCAEVKPRYIMAIPRTIRVSMLIVRILFRFI